MKNLLKPNDQTTARGGIGRWLSRPAGRFRRSAERFAPVSPLESRIEELLEAGYRVDGDAEITEMIERALAAALHDTGAGVGYIMTPGSEQNQLVVRAALCIGEPFPIADRCDLDAGPEGEAYRTGAPVVSTRERTQRGHAGAQRSGQLETHPAAGVHRDSPILCVPLQERTPGAGDARTVGVLTLRHLRPDAGFAEGDRRTAQRAAGLIAGILANARALIDRKQAVITTLTDMVRSLEGKDPYTMNHSHRVTTVCGLLAKQIDLDAATLQILQTGAMLHDIGKIGVPAGVLNKPGNLTEEELQLLKQYPIIGYNLCKPLNLGDEVLMLIRNHAEKLDGTGYPDRLRQGQLPLPLRILCVADAFDAMSSYRPYRKAMDARERNEQLNRFAGTQFDPTIVEMLKRLLNNGSLDELYRDQWQLSAEMHQLHQQSQRAA